MLQGPLFIVGSPRSGTKLFRDLLRRHPQIVMPAYETNFLPRALADADRWDLGSDEGFAEFYKWVTGLSYFRYASADGKILSEAEWRGLCSTPDVPGAFEALCRHDGGAGPDDDVIWGDKSPDYRLYLPALGRAFPNARFVHLIRDVRDVCLSSRAAWGKHMLRCAQRWADDTAQTRAWGAELGPDRYLEVRYEDLLSEPRAALEQVATFLGVSFLPDMLVLDRPSEGSGPTRVRHIVQSNTEKWRNSMDPATQRRIEALCGPLLEELGYARNYPQEPPRRLSKARMTWLRARDGAALFKHRVAGLGLRDALQETWRTLGLVVDD